jgi:hypothetical protein
MSLSTLSNASNNESDFFKRKFADFKTLERQLKDWQTTNFVQLKIRTSIPAKLNEDFSNGEEVALQKYELFDINVYIMANRGRISINK